MPGTYIFYEITADTTWSQKDTDFDLITVFPTADRAITLPDAYEGAMCRISNIGVHGSFSLTLKNPDASDLVVLPVGATSDVFVAENTSTGLFWDYHLPQALGSFRIGATPGVFTYTVSNETEDRTFDANATSTDELADVPGTLINDLASRGILAIP